jgi:radical SAM protein with 4Fe4S-binding SPASM domain
MMLIFSNLATPNAARYAENLSDMPIRWVVNVNPPKTWNKGVEDKITGALKHLKQKAAITFNIMPYEDDNSWAIDLINKYDLDRTIKIGFVLPTLTGSNYSLDEDEYSIVAQKVVDLAEKAEEHDIRLEYECGIPWCAFTPEQLGKLWSCNSVFFSNCDSIMDITPDGKVIYCLPLATMYAKHYTEFSSYPDAKIWYEKTLNKYRPLSRKEECLTCNLMTQSCRGGCLAKVLLSSNLSVSNTAG